MSRLMVSCLVLATTFLTGVAQAADLETAIAAVKGYLPAGENIPLKDCDGPIAATFMNSVHTTSGVYVSLAAYSAVGNDNYASFDLGSKSKVIDKYSDSGSELLIEMTNTNTDMMTRSAETKYYRLSIKAVDSKTRTVRIENYNTSLFKKSVMECTVKY